MYFKSTNMTEYFRLFIVSFSTLAAYKDLQTRKTVREAAWRRPGWDDCVAYTGQSVDR